MKDRLKTVSHLINNKEMPKYLYFIALIIYILIRTWDTTMFPRILLLNNIGLIAAFALIGLKIVFFDAFQKKELIFDILSMVFGVISYLNGGSIHFILLFWFAMGSHNIDFEDIIKVYLVVVAAICVLAFFAAKLEIIKELIYYLPTRSSFFWLQLERAYSLGGIYRTDTAARFFFWALALFYAKKGQGVCLSLFFLFLSVTVYILTQGRLDSICILILSIISLINTLTNKNRSLIIRKWHKEFWVILGILSIPVAAFASIVVVLLYNPQIGLFNFLNTLITDRLRLGAQAIEEYGVNLFGHELIMNGYGKLTEADFYATLKTYNYVDISFIQILLMNGIIVLIVLVIVYLLIAWKNRFDTELMICLFLIALNCVVAQHLLDISFVPFILLYTAVNKRIIKCNYSLKGI